MTIIHILYAFIKSMFLIREVVHEKNGVSMNATTQEMHFACQFGHASHRFVTPALLHPMTIYSVPGTRSSHNVLTVSNPAPCMNVVTL
jgi:hypothetical protein